MRNMMILAAFGMVACGKLAAGEECTSGDECESGVCEATGDATTAISTCGETATTTDTSADTTDTTPAT
jgi:hypothetical protein